MIFDSSLFKTDTILKVKIGQSKKSKIDITHVPKLYLNQEITRSILYANDLITLNMRSDESTILINFS